MPSQEYITESLRQINNAIDETKINPIKAVEITLAEEIEIKSGRTI